MVTAKRMNITNGTYYFYDDMVNIKNFDPNMLKLDKKSFKNTGAYYIGYITKKDKYKINSVNPLYIVAHRIDTFVEEKGSKYLNIASTESNSEVLRNMKKFEVKLKLGKSGEYGKDYMKIRLLICL